MLLLKCSDRVQHDLDRLKEMVRREGGREGRRDGRGVWCASEQELRQHGLDCLQAMVREKGREGGRDRK